MVNEFRLPDIGEGLTDAEVVAWHVTVGDEVTVDQLLVEVETAKAIVEITSPFAGVVLHLGAAEGEEVAVGEILLVIGDPGEVWEDGAIEAAGDAPPVADLPASDAGTPAPAGRVKAVPIVRKLARDRGVDLSTISGTGPGGAITRDDVLAAAISGSESAAAPPSSDERVPMSRIRRTIAENMSRSWREIPHVTVQADIDATHLLEAHREVRRQFDGPFPLEALVAQAVLPLLKEYPEFNATLDGTDLVLKRHYDVGFAVDTQDGLVVVVTRGTDGMGREALASEILQLAEAARARKAAPGDLAGQTFTISNIGALGGGPGTPIIPWGTTAILSIGRAIATPVARDGGIFIAPVAPLNLSYDHRVIDGALGQRFLSSLAANLEGFDTFI
jgi:pyruvate dehydrogenase E2 component (dihydrolipoamide acetyltransferase)